MDAAAPDPYAIDDVDDDDDDMVMVNGLDDPVINASTSKKGSAKDKHPKSKSTRELEPDATSPPKKDLPDRTRSKQESKTGTSKPKRRFKATNDFDDDIVMVDAGPSDGVDMADGPDDLQFITKPKGLQRSVTSSKKTEGKIGGLFGAFRKSRRASETFERPKSKGIADDHDAPLPRKRTVAGGEDSAKRPRRDDRKPRRSEKTDRAADGYVYDTVGEGGGATEAENGDIRRDKRRAERAERERAAKEAREEALKYEAERRAKRREADKIKTREDRDRKARKEEEAEAKQQEEKDARRAAREAKREKQANRDLENDILKPRSKRRDKDVPDTTDKSSRPRKSDRRRSHIDTPMSTQTPEDEEARRLRREDRRAKPSRRKSTAPVEDYFDPRNGTDAKGDGDNDPYGGNYHTSSWVKSQLSDPPEPPPVEPTIFEPGPVLGGGGADDLMADETMRKSSHRKPKRSSRMYTDPVADDQEERRRRRESRRVEKGGVKSSEGSPEGDQFPDLRRQSDLGGVKLGAGAKTFDGKTGQGKRASWFQKIKGQM